MVERLEGEEKEWKLLVRRKYRSEIQNLQRRLGMERKRNKLVLHQTWKRQKEMFGVQQNLSVCFFGCSGNQMLVRETREGKETIGQQKMTVTSEARRAVKTR